MALGRDLWYVQGVALWGVGSESGVKGVWGKSDILTNRENDGDGAKVSWKRVFGAFRKLLKHRALQRLRRGAKISRRLEISTRRVEISKRRVENSKRRVVRALRHGGF